MIPYSQLKQLAKDSNQEFDFPVLENHQMIDLQHQYLLSLITNEEFNDLTIQGKDYETIQQTTIPYLGYLQEQASFYCVSDEEFETLNQKEHHLYL